MSPLGVLYFVAYGAVFSFFMESFDCIRVGGGGWILMSPLGVSYFTFIDNSAICNVNIKKTELHSTLLEIYEIFSPCTLSKK